MSMKVARAALLAIGFISALNTAQASVVESFESGTWGPGWAGDRDAAGSVSTAAAHDGDYGVNLTGSAWTYNTSIAFTQGQTLSVWFRSNSGVGRFYLGFGADETGADSFVAATNTGDIRFQHNRLFDFEELNTSPQTWANHWYLASVTWNTDGTALGQLFDADGTTLLNSVTQSGLTRTGKGIALRGFDSFSVDTLSISAVPEPSSIALVMTGLAVAAGASMARRKRST